MHRHPARALVGIILAASGAAASPTLVAAAGTTELASVGAAGQIGDLSSFSPAISGDGRFVAFLSVAGNLAPNDANGHQLDAFVRDRREGTTTLVSVGPAGRSVPRGASLDLVMSRDGRYVAFSSDAPDLVPGDANGDTDVFARDTVARTTRLVSRGSAGQQSDGFSYPLAISATGRFVVFASAASNLVPGAPDTISLYVRDLKRGITTLESRRPDGKPSAGLVYGGASITPDGRHVAFASTGSDLVPGRLRSDTNIFLRDRRLARTVLVSAATDGTPADDRSFDPFISDDGRLVAFDSGASNLGPIGRGLTLDVYVRDVAARTTELVSVARNGGPAKPGLGGSHALGLSADGRIVLFSSGAPNLVRGDTNFAFDVFVRDRVAGVTTRVDLRADGGQSNRGSGSAAISADGRVVAFDTDGSHIVAGDTNGYRDVFVRARGD